MPARLANFLFLQHVLPSTYSISLLKQTVQFGFTVVKRLCNPASNNLMEVSMKWFSILSFAAVVTFCLCLGTGSLQAQDAPKSQLLSVHEDHVFPSKVEEYEKAALGLIGAIKAQKSPISFTAGSMSDFTYIYVTPVEDLGAVDKMDANWSELRDKLGKDAFGSLMKAFDGCYLSHRNYLVRLRPDLSYKPAYGAGISEGLNFRHWEFYHIYPGMEDQADAIAKEWAALYERLKSPDGYRLYSSSFGLEGPVFIVVQSGKNASDFYTRSEEWMKRAGDEGEALMNRTLKLIWKFETKDGMIRPDLSASPQAVIQSK
jgi:hypothetical protein